MVLLTSITISTITVIVYVLFNTLWGKEINFDYVRLSFILSIIGDGLFSAYFIHINNHDFFCSILYGAITSLSIFLLLGLAIVNIYGS